MQTQNQDLEQLRLLSLFHYIVAGLMALLFSIPIVHVVVGVSMLSGLIPMGPEGANNPPAELMGGLFLGVGLAVMFFGYLQAAVIAYGGYCLKRLQRRTFCFVAAGMVSLFMPMGTILGVFTIIVLMRDSVRQLFEARAPLSDL